MSCRPAGMVPDLHPAVRNRGRGQDLSDHLRLLLVASEDGRAARLKQRLREIGDAAILRVPPERDLPDAVAAAAPDAIIVDMARPERAALHDLRRVGAHDPRPVVMFVGFDDAAFLEEAIAAGISSYSVVRDAFPDLKPVVMAAVAIFRRHHQVITDLRQANTKSH
jgi:AmiR/NasT family two-component response regulator